MTAPSLTALFHTFTKIGLLSFGGPVAQIGVMHRELVEERGWISEDLFARGLSFSMLLPGPEAMQLCTYTGWRLRGTLGGLIAGGLFVLPGAVFMALITLAYLRWGSLPQVAPAFLGIKATVIVVVAMALTRMARRTLTTWPKRGLALGAFVALSLGASFPLVVLAAALIGGFALVSHAPTTTQAPSPSWRKSFSTLALWALLWLAPLVVLYATNTQPLADITAFFSRLAVFSFGGAYAALAWMAQALVETQGWLTPAQMVDGLGLAETTPGPLILVTQFAAMVATSDLGLPTTLAAAALSLWAIFIPCFGLVFTFAPHLDRLTHAPRLGAALTGVSAAIVGVIAALALYFAANVIFPNLPSDTMPSLPALALVAFASALLAVIRLPLLAALPIMAFAGIGLGWLT